MRALVIDEDVRTKIRQLKNFATKYPMTTEQLQMILDGTLRPIGDDPRYSIKIPNGFRVVYSIEHQPKFKIQHISISVSGEEHYPSVEAVDEIIAEFGFKRIKEQKSHFYNVYCEQETESINIMEEI